MPKQAIDRAWTKEQGAYNEQYLADVVKLTQSMVIDPTDMAATQRSAASQNEFSKKWNGRELVQESQDALEMMRRWAEVTDDAALRKSTVALVTQRADQHAQILAQKYSGAPTLLEKAIAFVPLTGADEAKASARIAGIRAQAVKLGDAANAQEKYLLAIAYYRAGGDKAKAEATEAKASQLMKQRLQPAVDKATAQAEALKKQFSDPAKVQAMRDQAEAAKKAMQQQAQNATQAAARKKSTDDLEKELGL
jgi:hypothetical protein